VGTDGETCRDCGRTIGHMEPAYLRKDEVLCEKCYRRLRAREPVPGASADRNFTETRSAKLEGVGLGFVGGVMIGAVFVVVGALLSFTGIGACIGIPMIIVGVVMPFVGPLMRLNNIKGKCPYCRCDVSSLSTDPGVTCPACKRRIIIRDKKFFRVEWRERSD